jgi:hypothetical protein
MKEAQEYVDIVHVSQGSIFHLSARYCIPTYFREPHKPLNVDYAAEVKKHLHVPVAVVGMITTLEQAEEIIASGKADIVAMAKSFMADGDIVRKSLRAQQAEIRPCTRCDLCGNANTWGTNMSCAINPRCGVSGQIQPVSENERKKVMVIGGGPNRIGHGIEFDYCCVHAALAMRLGPPPITMILSLSDGFDSHSSS